MAEITKETLFSSNTQAENEQLSILKRHFPNCFDKQGAFLPEKMAETLQSNGIKTEKESYSLNWLGKSYAKILKDRQPETLLAEDIEHNQKPENQNSENILIQGDNLEVLKHLKHAYKNQIKMIYIDPPYNTGSDGFVYQDDRKFTPQQLVDLGMDLEKAKRVLEFTAKKSNSHSAWLTFMYPRLYIARELLRDDGVIFISIDDNEQAQLKLLCDEVFGEENFIKDLIINTSEGGGNAKYVVNGHETVLVYAKNIDNFDNLKRPKDIRGKKIVINDELYWIQEDAIREQFGKYGNLHYEDIEEIKGIEFKKKIDDGIANNEYVLVPKTYGKTVIGKLRKISDDFSKFHSILNIGNINKHLTADGIRELEELFDVAKGLSPFRTPKPLDLLKRLVLSLTFKGNQNDIILDFFAGSGTTAHALMQLNAEDKGNRKFICVQLTENLDETLENVTQEAKKNIQIAIDWLNEHNKPHSLFEITKARIELAAKKIQTENPDYTGDLGFKIFKTEPHFQTALNTDFDPQIDFLPKNNLTDEQLHQLLTTWRVFDGCRLTEKVQNIDLVGYTAYYCRQHLYLLASGFTSENVKALIERLDNDKDFVPERIVLFGENIDSVMQKELAQAVKTYANKKGLNNLSVLARY
ncbi:site-specific DNA-methyltransferase [Haemophilus influenzae]|uniref:site-specific DNA-methyltransferase n=1 Tax=Haemophilus TaxID=724 RepID=UPI000681BB71|nr:site-specific DNA-methyltransferase [Haemophilus influenzae]KMZ25965.1 type III restriction endonuclease subunit M [Haemophilus influenzae]MCK8807053.1 site-specific DNA-methyltransferase [Haemophilus influenzae]MCK8881663.1 site-specific DNA-methyltransferase [Haemophilus influenzae]MCK9068225.1 site-specific DNA-methyltransferase [Haemophilus influenzae]OMP90809.1 type III restriction endonuclease subunit M [Haemophilus influenzae]